jgi:hypothetical protein
MKGRPFGPGTKVKSPCCGPDSRPTSNIETHTGHSRVAEGQLDHWFHTNSLGSVQRVNVLYSLHDSFETTISLIVKDLWWVH